MSSNGRGEKSFALIVANGAQPSSQILKKLVSEASYILAVDGGANYLRQNDIDPDAVLGDFDSISEDLLTTFQEKDTKILYCQDQEKNDLEKSLRWLIKEGFQSVVIIGIHGKREDHFFAALQLLKKYTPKVSIRIRTNQSEIFLLKPGRYDFEVKPKEIISLFGFPRAYNITTTNLKYALSGENLFEASRGISNEATGATVGIHFSKGNLLIFRNIVFNE